MAGYGRLCLYRGFSPDERLLMSGLGFYAFQETESDSTIADMFALQKQPFDEYLDELLAMGEWEPIDWPDNAEFLKLDPPFNKGYWQRLPSKDERISLARYGEPNKVFVFYRCFNGEYQQKQIPEWRIRDYFSNEAGNYGEYRRISTALLKRYGTLPAIKVKNQKKITEIHIGYRLPPSEEEFFKLYSWPASYDFPDFAPQVFKRKMTKQIYFLFKHELEAIGYCFVEE